MLDILTLKFNKLNWVFAKMRTAQTIVALLGILSNIVCTCIISVIGKRILWLVSMAGASLSCLALGEFWWIFSPYFFLLNWNNFNSKGVFAYNFIPAEWSSFDKHERIAVEGSINYIPMILFFALAFFSSVGVAPIPWILLSEVFPFK